MMMMMLTIACATIVDFISKTVDFRDSNFAQIFNVIRNLIQLK